MLIETQGIMPNTTERCPLIFAKQILTMNRNCPGSLNTSREPTSSSMAFSLKTPLKSLPYGPCATAFPMQ